MMTETATKYGGSLYELAAEEKQTDRVLEELGTILTLFRENPDYLRLLTEPSLTVEVRNGLLQEAFGAEIWPYLLNFLKLLCEKGYMGELKGCAREFRSRYNADHGIAEATVTTAMPLSDSQKTALKKKLEEMSGKQVDLTVYENPALIGGLRLDMEGKRYDGTASERLHAIGSIIKNTVV